MRIYGTEFTVASSYNAFVYHSEFTSLTNGVISFSYDFYKLLVEETRFTDCSKPEEGSCIYIQGNNTCMVVVNTISYQNHLTAFKKGLFICSSVAMKRNYNFILYTSIAYSNRLTYNSHFTVALYSGLIRVISTNSSNNDCYQKSSFLSKPSNNELTSITNYSKDDAYFLFCSISNNYDSLYECWMFVGQKQSSQKCNIINNSQESDGDGIISSHDAYNTISECCFLKNNNNGKGWLIWKASGTINIISCTIDKTNKELSGLVSTFLITNYQGEFKECNYVAECGPKEKICKGCFKTCNKYHFIKRNCLFIYLMIDLR
jgi:hypothetical protein